MRGKGKPFAAGPDPRRHEFTAAERQLGGKRGYAAAKRACVKNLFLYAWLWRRVRGHFRAKRRAAKGGAA